MKGHEQAKIVMAQNVQFRSVSNSEGVEFQILGARSSQVLKRFRMFEENLRQFGLRSTAVKSLMVVDALQLNRGQNFTSTVESGSTNNRSVRVFASSSLPL